jgi:hypothetical protein
VCVAQPCVVVAACACTAGGWRQRHGVHAASPTLLCAALTCCVWGAAPSSRLQYVTTAAAAPAPADGARSARNSRPASRHIPASSDTASRALRKLHSVMLPSVLGHLHRCYLWLVHAHAPTAAAAADDAVRGQSQLHDGQQAPGSVSGEVDRRATLRLTPKEQAGADKVCVLVLGGGHAQLVAAGAGGLAASILHSNCWCCLRVMLHSCCTSWACCCSHLVRQGLSARCASRAPSTNARTPLTTAPAQLHLRQSCQMHAHSSVQRCLGATCSSHTSSSWL